MALMEKKLQEHYKDFLSDFHEWDQKSHANDWLIFPKNIGQHLFIDETSVSHGELYTIVTNKAAKGKKGCIVAIVSGIKAEDVIKVLEKIPIKQRKKIT